MLQFPGFMTEYPWSTTKIPTSFLLPSQWPQPQSEELLLNMEESDYDDQLNEIRKTNNNLVVIGKTTNDNDKEDYDNEADDDDADNAEESEGEEFEQETG
ncbi:Anaphase-promoting complex subunit [Parasponia andersonii]|uniref:Anaphase-promoting complex subunit n=1 Tax=Parasponia andersonii TaxID=3476 RepID=A0A2P5DG69_PARAD|nr:Anaphase-promoting complex subunit [Parasponia andersonii]